MKFAIGTPVIHNGKFANVTGRDNGVEAAIIEYCDHRDGRFKVVADKELIIDQDSLDEEAAFQAENK